MIDWARVNELVDEIGAEDFDEVVELFLEEVGMAITGLQDAGGDARIVEEQMHFLKGAALNLGFDSLAQLCMQGEKSASEGRPEMITPQEVRQCFEASSALFEKERPNKLAA